MPPFCVRAPRPLRWLFLDMNSFFASCEQQAEPKRRGRPVIVVPVDSPYTCAIAASSEAKRLGITTNTPVIEARRRCPELHVVVARHSLYTEFHHKILSAVDACLPIDTVMSIDEMICQLLGDERTPERARALAYAIKASLYGRVGPYLRASIGIAPSRLLAKIAGDLEKPDGLTLLPHAHLPGPLLGLRLTDLPGIARGVSRRLARAGILDVASFWDLSPVRARAVWGSVEGERFWYGLHGIDTPRPPTQRRSISHSHVLAPALRPLPHARLIARRLLVKAASRLRRLEGRAGALLLFVRGERGERADAQARFSPTADNFRLLQVLDALWAAAVADWPAQAHCKQTGIVLSALELHAGADLFIQPGSETKDERSGARNGETNGETKGLRLSHAMDRLNQRYGRDTLALGTLPSRLPRFTGTKIAFTRIPDAAEFQE